MNRLQQIAERIDKLNAARHLDPHRDNSELDSNEGKNWGGDDTWIEAIDNNRLLWIGHGSLHFPDFRTIDFTASDVNHIEWTAQLNRYYWMRPLVVAYLKTGDKKYARVARETVEAWFDFHRNQPYLGTETRESIGRHGDSTLNISLRLGQTRFQGWVGGLPYFADSGLFDGAFVDKLLADAADKLEFMIQNHSKGSNWRMSELLAVFFCGQVLGWDRYVTYAVRQLNETIRNHFEPDGSHCEHTPAYHEWLLTSLRNLTILARNMPELGLDADPRILLNACRYMMHTYAPDGRDVGIGDSLRWNPLGPVVDLDAMRADYDGLVRFFGLDPEQHPPTPSGWFFDAGQFFLRDSRTWPNPDATMFIFDNTNSGGWHTHAGRGGVYLYHGGRMILTDPGSLNYDGADPFTAWGRYSFLHNTVTLSGMCQTLDADGRVRFHHESPRVAMINSIYTGGYFDEFTSRTGCHIRTFLWIKGKFALVLDAIDDGLRNYTTGRCRQNSGTVLRYESHWQFGDEPVTLDGATLSAHTTDAGGNVYIQPIYATDPIEAKRYCGSLSPVRGFIGKPGTSVCGGAMPSPMVTFEGVGNGLSRLAQLIVPFEGAAPPNVSAAGEIVDSVLHLTIVLNGQMWRFAINTAVLDGSAAPGMIGEMADLKSDAMLAVVCPDNGFAWMYNGKHLTLGDKTFLDHTTWGNWET